MERGAEQLAGGCLERLAAHVDQRGEGRGELGVAHVGQGVGDRGVGGEDHRLGRHHRARGVVVVRHQAPDVLGLVRLHQVEQHVLARGLLGRLPFAEQALAQVGDRIREQTREVEVQTGAIRSGLNDLAGLRTDFDSFLEKIRQEQGVVVAEMKSVYELISPRRVADELRQSLEAANRQLATSFREDLRSSLSELGQVNTALQLVKELGEQEKASREEQRQSLQASRATFEKGLAELTGATERLQQDLMTRLDRKLPMTSPVSMPAPPPAAALPQEAVRSLERIARGFENLAREIERNNGLLGEVVSAHSFYRTVMRRPREWWAGLRRMLTRRGGVNESEGLP